jgi:hypothetical protein
MRLSEAANEVIRLAEAIHAYWDRELPKRHPQYPWIRSGEDPGPPALEEAQLQDFLKRLPADQVYALALLMYIGRGDERVDHLAERYQTMKETFQTPEHAIAQITSKRALDEYLTDGLAEIKKGGIDVDTIPWEAVPKPTHS